MAIIMSFKHPFVVNQGSCFVNLIKYVRKINCQVNVNKESIHTTNQFIQTQQRWNPLSCWSYFLKSPSNSHAMYTLKKKRKGFKIKNSTPPIIYCYFHFRFTNFIYQCYLQSFSLFSVEYTAPGLAEVSAQMSSSP